MIKLNLGCGNKKLKGYINVDLYGSPDLKHDLNLEPYPFEHNSVDYIFCEHALEHLKEPELFWREIYRILKKEAAVKIIVPHYKSKGAYCSFGHRGFYHEDSIDSILEGSGILDASNQKGFKLISRQITRGRFLKWQKREIIWILKKL